MAGPRPLTLALDGASFHLHPFNFLMDSSQFKQIVYPLIDGALGAYGYWRLHNRNLKDTVFMSGTGRSGSTWLAEMLTVLPGYHILYEPFHLGSNQVCRQHGFTWNNYIRPGADAPEKKAYVKRILNGRELSTRTLNRHVIRPLKLLRVQGFVVKSINANMMLAWLSEVFPVKTILLLRHPCAVVASQLKAGGWSWRARKDAIYLPDQLMDDHPHLQKIYDGLSSSEENLAFNWAIQNFIPLRQRGSWLTTTYEKLVRDEDKELERIFSYLDQPIPQESLDRFGQESTSRSSFHIDEKSLLTGWRNHLSASQVRSILDVTHRVGVTCYTDEVHPNYDMLLND